MMFMHIRISETVITLEKIDKGEILGERVYFNSHGILLQKFTW